MHCSWEEFYPGTQPYNRTKYSSEPVSQNSGSKYYVYHCIFFNSKQGAIKFDLYLLSTMVLIEDTLYWSCSNTDTGGTLKLGGIGQFAQNRICSYQSRTVRLGTFCSTSLSINEYPYKIIDSSVASSGYKDKGYDTFFCYGAPNISNINSSGNSALDRSLFAMIDLIMNSTIIFSTFASNTNTGNKNYDSGFIWMNPSSSCFIQRCNFLNNVGANSALIWGMDIDLYISNCCFHRNKRFGYIFSTQECNMIVENCFITDKISTNNTPTLKNNNQIYYIYDLSHFSPADCTAENPPIFTDKEETQIAFYSCHDMYTFLIFYAYCE